MVYKNQTEGKLMERIQFIDGVLVKGWKVGKFEFFYCRLCCVLYRRLLTIHARRYYYLLLH